MSLDPSISVVTRTYNRSHLLRCISRHLKAQTVQDFEWIIIDDCGDFEVMDQDLIDFKPDFGVKILRNDENIGLAKSAHKGISEASGTYILLHDDDDLLLPTALQSLRGVITGNFIGSTGGVRRISQSGKKEAQYIPKRPPLISEIGYRNNMTTIATMFLKSAYLEAGGINPDLTVLEDWDLWLKLLLIGDFATVPKVLGIQRVGAEDQTLNETHLNQAIIMRNNYLRNDIKSNALGLGYITNISAPEVVDRADYLFRRLARIKSIVPFKIR